MIRRASVFAAPLGASAATMPIGDGCRVPIFTSIIHHCQMMKLFPPPLHSAVKPAPAIDRLTAAVLSSQSPSRPAPVCGPAGRPSFPSLSQSSGP
ncbi:unnamed protein product [Soboliphyme baturini]|uniref:Secreted protein n=1 Tax=Soboliphyme baturini TaxID=241478 RepID=A0A183IWK8_9BILA|nr:unnamed protein product [Soboliphyme baturini]